MLAGAVAQNGLCLWETITSEWKSNRGLVVGTLLFSQFMSFVFEDLEVL